MSFLRATITPEIRDGVVAAVNYAVGDLVEDGAELIRLDAAED